MRLFSVALLTALFVPPAAFAQPVKQVEVTNLPAVQQVTGTVEVTNDVANPVEIIGEVSVTNLHTPTAERRYQLVGFTTAMVLATEGPFGFTRACGAEFLSSRWCTSAEILDTVNLPALSGEAWVRGIYVGHSISSWVLDVASGFGNSAAYFTCGDWKGTAGRGFTVSATGTFGIMGCTGPRSVACCAPVP
jgi:hypothetical protein